MQGLLRGLRRRLVEAKGILSPLGITMPNIYRNPETPRYYEIGIPHSKKLLGEDSFIADTGAYVAYSGAHTEPCESVKVVRDPFKENDIVWDGRENIPLELKSYKLMEDLAVYYLNTRDKLYIVDGFVGALPEQQLKVRCICSRTYHALLISNSLYKPTKAQLETQFQEGADIYIFNAGEFPANRYIEGVDSDAFVVHNYGEGKHLIFGTEFGGQMRRTIREHLNYSMPRKGQLPFSSAALEDERGRAMLIIGGPKSGKTALCFDKYRMVGDGQMVWGDGGMFSVFGGCYPRLTNLVREKQPSLYACLNFGTVIENALFFETEQRRINFFDKRISTEIKGMVPLSFVPNVKESGIAEHPSFVVLLSSDMTGTLPLVSRLSLEQAVYYYALGYSHKLVEELGKVKAKAIYPSCFDEARKALPDSTYVKMFRDKLEAHRPQVFLLNTGYFGGQYGEGSKVSIEMSEAYIRAIYDDDLSDFQPDPIFGLQVPQKMGHSAIPGPDAWVNKDDYTAAARSVIAEFRKVFD